MQKSPLPLSDEELLHACANGAGDAFRMLAGRYERRLAGYCMRCLRQPADADDALQIILQKMFVISRRYQDRQPFVHWLFTTARTTCLELMRQRKRANPGTPILDSFWFTAETDDPLTCLVRQELRELLVKNIQSLSADDQTLLLSRYVENRSWREIALQLQQPESTLRDRISMITKELRQSLK